MNSDEQTGLDADAAERLSRLIGAAGDAGIDLGDVPETPSAEWLDEKEALLASPTEDSEPDMPSSEESNDGESEESVRDSDSSSSESPSDDPQSESESPDAAEEADESPDETSGGGGSSSTDTGGQWDVFKPGNGELVAFGAYTINGAIWASVLALELVGRGNIDGLRGVVILTIFFSFLLNILVKRGFARPDDQSGPSGTARFLQDGLSLGLSGMLGTVSGVALGLAFSASGSDLSDTFGYGTSVGGALGLLVLSLLIVFGIRGALAHGNGKKSPIGAGILGLMGLVALAQGAMNISIMTGLLDRIQGFQTALSELGGAPTESAALPDPAFTADPLTTFAVSDVWQQARLLVQDFYVSCLALGAIVLGVGLILGSLRSLGDKAEKREKLTLRTSTLVRTGMEFWAVGLSFGAVLAIDAAFVHVGAGPMVLQTNSVVLASFLLIPVARSMSAAVMHLRKGHKHLKAQS